MRLAREGLLSLLLFIPCATTLCAQTIQITLVNGKTGRPSVGICVGVWTNDTAKTVHIPTDKDGIARLSLTHNDNEVDISHVWKPCGANGAINPVLKYDDLLRIGPTFDNPSCASPESVALARWKEIEFSTKEVLQHGIASANTCSKITLSPQPGKLILFVRTRSLREKVQDWKNSDTFPF